MFLTVVSLVALGVGPDASAYKARASRSDSPIVVTATTIGERFCAGDEQTFTAAVELSITVKNVSPRPIVWPRDTPVAPTSRVARSASDAQRGMWVSELSGLEITGNTNTQGRSGDRWFVVVPPGQTYQTRTTVDIVVQKPNVSDAAAGAVPAGGSYVVSATLRLWRIEQIGLKVFQKRQKEWKRKRYHVPEVVEAPLVEVFLPESPHLEACGSAQNR